MPSTTPPSPRRRKPTSSATCESEGDLILSLLAYDGKPAGHIAYSHLALHETPSVRACVLAPLAVSPAFQNQGVGTALVRRSLQRLTDDGYDLVVVLGEPSLLRPFRLRSEAGGAPENPL